MIKKQSGHVRELCRKWGAAAVASAMLLTAVSPAFGYVSETGRYENTYDTEADSGKFSVSEGDKERSAFVLNTEKDILPYPDEGGGVAEMRLVKGGTVTDANYNHEFKDNPVYSFGENEKATVEMKVRFSQRGNVKNILRLDDTVNNVNGDPLVALDDGAIYSSMTSGKQLLAGEKGKDYAYSSGRWYHLFLILSGNTYDLYFEGEKLNSEPLKLSAGNQKQITRVVNIHRTWSDESSYYDDLRIQPLKPLCLDSGTVTDGAQEVSEKLRKLVLDFNTPLDKATIANMSITDANGTLNGNYSIEADSIDMTRVNISLPDGMTLSNTYTIHYDGLRDLLGNVLDGELDFTTRNSPSPAEAEKTVPVDGAVSVALNPTVTFTFNKSLDAATVTNAAATVSPAAEIAAVTLQDPYTVAVNFAQPLKPNRIYTVGITDAILDLEDGLPVAPAQVSFTTAYTADMVVDEFEFADGFIPELVGITDRNGNVVNPAEITASDLRISMETANPQNYDGDACRIFMGGSADDTKLIYHMDGGIRDAVMAVYSNLSPSTPEATYDLQFAVAEKLEDLNNTSTLIDVTEKVEKVQLSTSAKDNFYPYSYTYKAGEKAYPYFVIRMRRRLPGTAWTPKLASVKFNSLLPAEGGVETMGDSTVIQLDSLQTPAIPFSIPLDDTLLNPGQFVINGRAATGLTLDSTGKKVLLTPAVPLTYSAVYTLELGDGIRDLYGRPILGGGYSLLTPHAATLCAAELKGVQTLPASGSVIPAATVECQEPGAEVVVYAAYYVDGKMAELSMKKAENLAAGRQTIELPELNITSNSAGCYVQIFARTDTAIQRPLPGIVTVDASGVVFEGL